MLRENTSLVKENEKLKNEQQYLLKSKDMADAQVTVLAKSLEALQKEMKDKEILVNLFVCSMFYKSFHVSHAHTIYLNNCTSGSEFEAISR